MLVPDYGSSDDTTSSSSDTLIDAKPEMKACRKRPRGSEQVAPCPSTSETPFPPFPPPKAHILSKHTAPAPKNAAGTFLALAFVSIHPASDILDAISSALESAIQRYAPDVDLQLLATGKGVPGKPAHEGPGELHMSLSRCPRIKFHMIEMLVHDLREQCSAITPFEVSFTEACCLLNDDATKTFVCAKVSQGHDNAVQLVHAVNRAFHLHGLPQYYEEVIPHVSVGCIQGRKDREGQHAVAALKQALSELDWKHDVREIALVIGKKRYAVHLGMKSTK